MDYRSKLPRTVQAPGLPARHAEGAGFSCFKGEGGLTPILLSVPHAGRYYPNAVHANLRVPAHALQKLEDRYSDLLVRDAVQQGHEGVIAHYARAWLDLNRYPDDLTPGSVAGMPAVSQARDTHKSSAGLGLIPSRLIGYGPIWRRRWDWADVQRRVSEYHAVYHMQLERALAERKKAFGFAVLIDVHSMPSLPPDYASGQGWTQAADCIVGDRFGGSANNILAQMVLSQAENAGFLPAYNQPYAGGYVLERHGNPAQNIYALQLEFDRALYLDMGTMEPSPDVAIISRFIARLANEIMNLRGILSDSSASDLAIAAE